MDSDALTRLSEAFAEGSIKALARAITIVENRRGGWLELLSSVYKARTDDQCIIGITGGAGVGKSTLVGQLAACFEADSRKVAILAFDPSSPYSGGAFLGDRVRMTNFTGSQVYFRSMASRGKTGGLAVAATDVIGLLLSFGYDTIILETVGVGQDEVEVVKIADTVGLVLVPGQGDAIQAMKAGLMEIASCYIVNKSDLPGADQVVADVQSMLSTSDMMSVDFPEVLKVTAQTGERVPDLAQLLMTLSAGPNRRNDQNLEEHTRQVLFNIFQSKLSADSYLREIVNAPTANAGGRNPYNLAMKYLEKYPELLSGPLPTKLRRGG